MSWGRVMVVVMLVNIFFKDARAHAILQFYHNYMAVNCLYICSNSHCLLSVSYHCETLRAHLEIRHSTRVASPLLSPSRCLRSASDTRIFRVLRVGRRTLGERSFQYTGPVIWNSLPLSVRHSPSLSSFKSKVETDLFSSAY